MNGDCSKNVCTIITKNKSHKTHARVIRVNILGSWRQIEFRNMNNKFRKIIGSVLEKKPAHASMSCSVYSSVSPLVSVLHEWSTTAQSLWRRHFASSSGTFAQWLSMRFVMHRSSSRREHWNAWISANVLYTGHITRAGIYSLSGREWGACSGLLLRPEEVVRIASAFHQPEKVNDVTGDGVLIANGAFRCILVGHSFLYLKDRQSGLMARKCGTCIVIATFGVPKFASTVRNILERAAAFLQNNGLWRWSAMSKELNRSSFHFVDKKYCFLLITDNIIAIIFHAICFL